MRRRTFVAGLGATAGWPLAARAQQQVTPVIGFLGSSSPDLYTVRLRAFHEGLKEAGYVEGQNVAIEYRWAEGRYDRLPALAAELVEREVTVIVAGGGTPSAFAAKAATSKIPIVFETGGDPVLLGLVTSFNRPSGNLTGVSNLNVKVAPKWLELLRELLPKATSIAVLVNPTSVVLTEQYLRDMRAAAPGLGIQLHVLHAATESDFDAAFAAIGQLRADALIIGPDIFLLAHAEQLGALALRHSVPALSQYRRFAEAGGLMGYGATEDEPYRLVGISTAKILKGDKPADLPVQQATKVELTVNLKAARALGLTVPLSLLGRADEVFE